MNPEPSQSIASRRRPRRRRRAVSGVGIASGFRYQVTNPRGYSTTTSYQAFDTPDTSSPVQILAPEGQTTNEPGQSDFLNPRPSQSIASRRRPHRRRRAVSGPGLFSCSVINTRRLCKRIEPETGATLFEYDVQEARVPRRAGCPRAADGNGNVVWSAEGTTLDNEPGQSDFLNPKPSQSFASRRRPHRRRRAVSGLGIASGFRTQVTNPRGYSTTTSHQVFGTPNTSSPVQILAAE